MEVIPRISYCRFTEGVIAVCIVLLNLVSSELITHDMSVSSNASTNGEVKLFDSFVMTCAYSNLQHSVALGSPAITWAQSSACTRNKRQTIYTSTGIRIQNGYVIEPEQLNVSSGSGEIKLNVTRIDNSIDPDCYTFTYTCIVNTFKGVPLRYDEHVYTAKLNVTLVDPAQILSISDSMVVTEGENVTLVCDASGLPQPEVRWSLANERALPPSIGGGLSYLAADDGAFTIPNIDHHASGTYVCSVWNRLLVKPEVKAVNISIRYKPQVKVQTFVVYQKAGYHTELVCDAVADPPIDNSYWVYVPRATKQSEEAVYTLDVASDGDRYREVMSRTASNVTTGSALIISPVTAVDFSRRFCCIFVNNIGRQQQCIDVESSSVAVMVNGKMPIKASSRSHSICHQISLIFLSASLLSSVSL